MTHILEFLQMDTGPVLGAAIFVATSGSCGGSMASIFLDASACQSSKGSPHCRPGLGRKRDNIGKKRIRIHARVEHRRDFYYMLPLVFFIPF